jgi:hypothetical protein
MSATSRQLAMVCSAFVSMTSEEKWIEGKRERRERERVLTRLMHMNRESSVYT